MKDCCDLCQSDQLEPVYRAPTGVRGLTVYVCRECGLVQSLPRIDHVPNREVSVSGGADWGNIRYGKSFRTEQAIATLHKTIDMTRLSTCLDVGSNRGSFVTCLKTLAPQVAILAVEPDPNIVSEYSQINGIEVVIDRIERLALPQGKFDLIYCNHTLEHLRSPRATLAQMREALSPQGVLLLEVPNVDFVERDDVLEEWFIDKHLYHFSQEILCRYLQLTGFSIIDFEADAVLENLTVVARQSESSIPVKKEAHCAEARKRLTQIRRYQAMIQRNEKAVQDVARHIEELARTNRVVLWGAGRIFDLLVREGTLDVHALSGVVDKHLGALAGTAHGVPIQMPSEVSGLDPDIVMVASRTYFEEIRQEVRQIKASCTVLSVTDLLLGYSDASKVFTQEIGAVVS